MKFSFVVTSLSWTTAVILFRSFNVFFSAHIDRSILLLHFRILFRIIRIHASPTPCPTSARPGRSAPREDTSQPGKRGPRGAPRDGAGRGAAAPTLALKCESLGCIPDLLNAEEEEVSQRTLCALKFKANQPNAAILLEMAISNKPLPLTQEGVRS